MSLTVKSISPVSISDPDLPIALRPAVDFSPARGSIFDDPGDEKSWHVSQRSDGLLRYFEGREPSWYASAVAPLEGADRVLDLGCGPGLALRALLDRGTSTVLGIDRWPAFVANSTPDAPIIAHDLTLPMPFLESGSFDGVLSHYALDYVSPIGMRQVLREAHRVLAAGGRLVIYVAAVGAGSGDPARTAVYSPSALRTLLLEVGFEEVEVEATSNGRNSVALAHKHSGPEQAHLPWCRMSIDSDTQISAAFSRGTGIQLELVGSRCQAELKFDLPSPQLATGEPAGVAVCARVLHLPLGGAELQVWAWRGYEPVMCDCARFEFDPVELRIASEGDIEHVSAWQPAELSIEPPGNAYVQRSDIAPGGRLSEAERGAEGRQVLIEASEGPAEASDVLGPGRNRFLVKRATNVNASSIDHGWLAGTVHGLVFEVEELQGERHRDLLLWAAWRQGLVYLCGENWRAVLSIASARRDELRSPTVLVDPTLCVDATPGSVPSDVVAFAKSRPEFFLVLSEQSRRQSNAGDLARIPGRVLHGGPAAGESTAMLDANEGLRHLTERTTLMRLRQVYGHSPAEVGRRRAVR